jgi:histidine triad (HIT) family protein
VLGSLLVAVSKIAAQEKLEGYRVVINDGEAAGQSVFHLHAHILGGRPLAWCVRLWTLGCVCMYGVLF